MRSELLIKSFVPGAAVAGYRIVKHDTTDTAVIQADSAADLSIGVSSHVGAAAGDDTVDVVMAGITEVELGGSVTRGQPLTSDANGKAVTAAATNATIGRALSSGVSGDIVPVMLSIGTV